MMRYCSSVGRRGKGWNVGGWLESILWDVRVCSGARVGRLDVLLRRSSWNGG